MPSKPPFHRSALVPSRQFRDREHDARRNAERPTRRLYGLARWKRLRADQLQREPLCRFCLEAGVVTPATVCDHVRPHRDNEAAFWRGPFQSLCAGCHDKHKQREEHGRVVHTFGPDGWPLTGRDA